MTGRGRAGNPSRSPAIACLLLSAACGDPPVPLPTSGSLPADDVHLGMTFRELLEARPGAMLFPDTGVVEELWRGRYHYGFTANPPRHRSRLVYVDRVRDEMQGDYARREWDRLVRSLAAELDLQPHCAAIEYARLRWRRAMLRGDGRRGRSGGGGAGGNHRRSRAGSGPAHHERLAGAVRHSRVALSGSARVGGGPHAAVGRACAEDEA